MSVPAYAGVGTTIGVGDGASPEVFTTIAAITSISGPELSAEEIEVTSLDTTGGYKEYITGLKDGGTVTLELNWLKSAQQVQIRNDLNAGTARNYKITWPTSPDTTVIFNAVPTSFSMNTEPQSALTATVALRMNGDPTWG